jgi:protein tyrosine phosphatase (PTP) superfamily phosphohydrolase (DUF442 family)
MQASDQSHTATFRLGNASNNREHKKVNIQSFQRRAIIVFLAAVFPVAALAGPEVAGVDNFLKLNDHVYRGAQPTELGFQNLAKLGIQTVIDLQEAGDARSVGEAKSVKAAGMLYISVPMKGMETPASESVAKVLAVLENTTTGPVFVHCHRGADRTGGVIACYRIEHDNWTSERALAEARSMGMSWYQVAIQHFVQSFKPQVNQVAAAATNAMAAVAPAATVQ